jgi:hypothetical protein
MVDNVCESGRPAANLFIGAIIVSTSVDAPGPIAEPGDTKELHRWLGRRDAFSLMAGRCSAADVECIKRIRDNKLYLSDAKDWGEFCENVLHMSRSNANHLIAVRDELGDEYFYIAQATRISLKEYRASIASNVRQGAIECNGESIPLIPENSQRVTAAVSTLRAAAPPKQEIQKLEHVAAQENAASLVADAERIIQKFRALRRKRGQPDRSLTLQVAALWEKFAALIQEIG